MPIKKIENKFNDITNTIHTRIKTNKSKMAMITSPIISEFVRKEKIWRESETNTEEEYLNACYLLSYIYYMFTSDDIDMGFLNSVWDLQFANRREGDVYIKDVIIYIVYYYIDSDFIAEAHGNPNLDIRNLQRKIVNCIHKIQSTDTYKKIYNN